MTEEADFSSSLASTEIDASAHRIGVVYAKALFQAATKANAIDEVASNFTALMQVLEQHPTFDDLFHSGLISSEDRVAMLRRAFVGNASPVFVQFLQVVGGHDRTPFLRAIYRAFRDLNDDRTGQVRVKVITAAPLDAKVREQLAASLEKSLGRKPIFEATVDPKLIGGVQLRVGDTVYDASVASQLEDIRTQMIDRTVHAIQSRRNSFRTAEGN